MREEYGIYIKRIHDLIENHACLPPEWEYFSTAPGLNRKFAPDGAFRPFYGDTTVFPLPEDVQKELGVIQTSLYDAAGGMLSQALPVSTFHITLHDLSASESQTEISERVKYHQAQMPQKLSSIRNQGRIHLRAAGLVSMVASSVVMLFEPASAADHSIIQHIYGCMDELLPLSYPLTLHCTLAYYKPGTYAPREWNALEQFMLNHNREQINLLEFELDSAALEYHLFRSMKDYCKAL